MILDWQPIETAPHGTWVLVCGPNLAQPPVAFIVVAIFDAGDPPLGSWVGIDGRLLRRMAYFPLFWCPLPVTPAMP